MTRKSMHYKQKDICNNNKKVHRKGGYLLKDLPVRAPECISLKNSSVHNSLTSLKRKVVHMFLTKAAGSYYVVFLLQRGY